MKSNVVWKDELWTLAQDDWSYIDSLCNSIWIRYDVTYCIGPAMMPDPQWVWDGMWRLYRAGEPRPPLLDLSYVAESDSPIELAKEVQ